MTFAPATMLEVRAFVVAEDKAAPVLTTDEVGIVGDGPHVIAGTGYHLGKDQLKFDKNPYSARTARDKAGLADAAIANAACAIDLDDDWDELRRFSGWAVEQCRKSAPDTLDIREIIYSLDGVNVLHWDRENGVTSAPQPSNQLDHRTHSHISKYRDSTRRSLLPLFKRFYREVVGVNIPGDDMSMFVSFGDGENVPGGLDEVADFQTDLRDLGADFTPVGGIDGKYGKGTQARYIQIVGAELAGDGTHYNYRARRWVKDELEKRHILAVVAAYLKANPPAAGGTVPPGTTLKIGAHTLVIETVEAHIPEQTVTVIDPATT
jgi:hypothetical protein